jgi:tetratricopeptide (TPR) repeat protein
VLACLASCGGGRAPAPLDVDAALARRGPIEARRDLEIRVIGDPRDVAGRLALAALDERIHRPSEAIDALEAVVALGGPLGVRWHAEDQARLARLIAARGRARLARGAKAALADLERARRLGAVITGEELRGARIAAAMVALRHSDPEVRNEGRRTLAALAAPARPAGAEGQETSDGSDAWRGARIGASPGDRGRFGAWLWGQGARHAAWDELSAWHAAAPPPRDQALQDAYLAAARWWTPIDLPGPPADDLVGRMRCAFVPCAPHEIAGEYLLERAYVVAPVPPPVRDPADAAALAVITLHQALRGEASWGPALAARVDLAAVADPKLFAKLPRYVQPIFARLVGRDAPIPGEGTTPDQRLVIAAERVLAGAGVAEIAPLIGTAPYADELRRVVATRAPFTGDARAEAAARHASLAVRDTARPDELRAIVVAYLRDPAIGDRLGRDAVAGATDAAAMHATLATLFDALGDPARARAAWQAAIDGSPEPAFLRGLAEAQARQGDPDAALITATTAAAASGDPAVVWTSVARALDGAGKYVHALDAARSAIDLSGPETLAAALEVAISASQALGREDQAEALAVQRARIAQGKSAPGDSDPTDAAAALEAYRRHPSGSTIARMWVASRWNPRDIELRAALLGATTADDARHAVITGELVDLAGDRDPALRRAAVAALR